MPDNKIPKASLIWTPAQGRKSREKPCNPWHRKVEKDLKKQPLWQGIETWKKSVGISLSDGAGNMSDMITCQLTNSYHE